MGPHYSACLAGSGNGHQLTLLIIGDVVLHKKYWKLCLLAWLPGFGWWVVMLLAVRLLGLHLLAQLQMTLAPALTLH